MSKKSPVTISLCFLVALLEGFDIQAAGVAAPKLTAALGLSPNMLGTFFTASTVGMLIGAFIGGRASDAFGRKPVLLVSVATFGICSILTGLAGDLSSLVIARFFTGFGLGGALPALIALAAEQDPARRGRAVALMYAGTPLGGAGAGISSALFADWQAIFHIGGVLPLLVLPLLWLFLDESHAPRPERSSEQAGVAAALFESSRIRDTLILWAAFFLGMLVLYLLLNWTPMLLSSRGFTMAQIAAFQATLNIVGALVVMLASLALDGHRLVPIAIAAYVGSAVALLIVAKMPLGIGFAVAGAGALLGAAMLTAQSILYATAPRIYGDHVRGTGVGAAIGVGRAGSVTGPLLAGSVLSAGMAPAQLILITIPIILLGGLANLSILMRLKRKGL